MTDAVTDAALRNALSRFGAIKDLDIVRSKACAFFEFTTVEAARRAISVSLPAHQGGEGGIRVGDPSDTSAPRIYVDTRKERGERPTPRNPQANGERGRGGFRGRGGGSRGRGGPQQK